MKTLLHAKTAAQLDAVMRRPAGSVIFHGPRGLGKMTVAREMAARLNCLGDTPTQCANCRQIEAGNFPDFITIDRGEKAGIAIEQVRRLIGDLSLRPYRTGGTRFVIIDGAHLLSTEAQNALLKLLEEPPPRTLIILVSEQLETLLLTVRSRCRLVRFVRPDTQSLVSLLTSAHGLERQEAENLAAVSGGAPGTAIMLASNPAETAALLALTRDAAGAGGQSLFTRLLLASRLSSAGADLERFGEALHHSTVARLMSGQISPESASTWLGALERFRTQLSAKVSSRVALERLMLELD